MTVQRNAEPLARRQDWNGTAKNNLRLMRPKRNSGIDDDGEYIGLTDADLEREPDLEWLVDGVFPAGGFGVLFGKYGTAKSFLSLDLAHSIALGEPWHGHDVISGPVVYVAAEGSPGLKKRVRAWKRSRGVRSLPAVCYFPRAANLLKEEDVVRLIRLVERRRAVLVVIDTLSACFVGGDENASRDMGSLVDSVRRIIDETGAAVLLLHHTTKKDPSRERGHGQLPGAADVLMNLTGNPQYCVTLTCAKQKDASAFEDLAFQLVTVDDDPALAVLAPMVGKVGTVQEKAIYRQMLDTLRDFGHPVTNSEWRSALQLPKQIPERTFNRHVAHLVSSGLVDKTDTKPPVYEPTATANQRPTTATGSDPGQRPATATPLRSRGGSLDGWLSLRREYAYNDPSEEWLQ